MEGNCTHCGAPLELGATHCAYCDSVIPGAMKRLQAEAEAAAAREKQEAAEAQAKAEAVKETAKTVGAVVGASLLSNLFNRRSRSRYTAPPPPPQGRMGGMRGMTYSGHSRMGGMGRPGGMGGPGRGRGGFGGPGGGRGPGGRR